MPFEERHIFNTIALKENQYSFLVSNTDTAQQGCKTVLNASLFGAYRQLIRTINMSIVSSISFIGQTNPLITGAAV